MSSPRTFCSTLLAFTCFLADASGAEIAPMPRDVTHSLQTLRQVFEKQEKEKTLDQVVSEIDRQFERFWKSNEVVPAPLSDDAEFLRRVSLDIVGRIPSAAETRTFLEDRTPNKRAKKIDELLARPAFSNHFTSIYRQSWVPDNASDFQLQFAIDQFEPWLRKRIKENVPMDRMVRELLTAPTLFNGRQSFDPSNGMATVFLQANEFKPENVASAASRLFMGVKIECAQCHNHPFAPYKREQFWELAAFFSEVQPAIANLRDPKFKREIKIPESTKLVQARFFDGQDPTWDANKSPRQTFVDWLTSDENPYFARNTVNRTWAHFLGLGLIEPVDEPSDENPPVLPELLEYLTKVHVATQFDNQFLMRAIARTKVYQLTSKQTHPSQEDRRQFARANVKAMTAEQLFDSLGLATGFYDPNIMQQRRFQGGMRNDFLVKFASTEHVTEKQTSILQALTLMNGKFVNDQTSLDKSMFLAGVVDSPLWNTTGKVEMLFLASLNRVPTPSESEKFSSYVDRGGGSGDKKKALADVFWSLLNSSEFIINH